MNERLYSHEREISDDEKRALINRARQLAPYNGQRVDNFGAYATNFDQKHGGYTSIYIPSMAGLESEDEMIDDAVRIIERVIVEENENVTIIRNKSYKIHEASLEATYGEAIKVFDTETGKPIRSEIEQDLSAVVEAYDLEQKHGPSPVFTHDRLREVNELLDSLDPSERW